MLRREQKKQKKQIKSESTFAVSANTSVTYMYRAYENGVTVKSGWRELAVMPARKHDLVSAFEGSFKLRIDSTLRASSSRRAEVDYLIPSHLLPGSMP